MVDFKNKLIECKFDNFVMKYAPKACSFDQIQACNRLADVKLRIRVYPLSSVDRIIAAKEDLFKIVPSLKLDVAGHNSAIYELNELFTLCNGKTNKDDQESSNEGTGGSDQEQRSSTTNG